MSFPFFTGTPPLAAIELRMPSNTACAACAALELFPGLFVSLFNDKPELVEIAVWALHIYAAGMFMLGVQFSCQQTFVALGQTRVSLFLALLRKVILLIPYQSRPFCPLL